MFADGGDHQALIEATLQCVDCFNWNVMSQFMFSGVLILVYTSHLRANCSATSLEVADAIANVVNAMIVGLIDGAAATVNDEERCRKVRQQPKNTQEFS